MSNRLANETSPYLLQHKDNPVDWYAWGDEAFARARARGQADPALRRLLGLPLVPRHGARVVRERRHRRADERALRQHQGRPRGAPGRRRHLHAGRAGADRPRRLADDRLPHAGRHALLRRHLLPARGPAGHARLPAPAHGRRRRLPEQARATSTAPASSSASTSARRRRCAPGDSAARRPSCSTTRLEAIARAATTPSSAASAARRSSPSR